MSTEEDGTKLLKPLDRFAHHRESNVIGMSHVTPHNPCSESRACVRLLGAVEALSDTLLFATVELSFQVAFLRPHLIEDFMQRIKEIDELHAFIFVVVFVPF